MLFPDEPTTGLDPQNRANLWDLVRSLRSGGVTISLTAHYLEEADALSDRLAIIDHGRIVAEDTPEDLKAQVAAETVILRPAAGKAAVEDLRLALSGEPFVYEARLEGEALRFHVRDGSRGLSAIFGLLDRLGVGLKTISLSQPSLDDVFLRRPGRALRGAGHPADEVMAS